MNPGDGSGLRRFLSVCCLILAVVASTQVAAANQSTPFPAIDPGSGFSLETLASGEASWEPLSTMGLQLERVTPDGETSALVSGGPELWFAEAGAVEITASGQSTTLAPGDSAVVDATAGIDVTLSGADCPSALRLVVAPVFAMIAESSTSGPSLPPQSGEDCPEPAVLIDGGNLIAPPMPVELFIGRLTAQPGAWLDLQPVAVPIGLAMEEGRVSVTGAAGFSLLLAPGGWLTLNAETPVAASETDGLPASILIVAALPAGPATSGASPAGGTVVAPDHTSPLFGYVLSWDDTWAITEESANETSERLVLSNGVSTLYVESFGNYGETARTCIEGVLNRTLGDPAYSNFASLDGVAGTPPVIGDDLIAASTMSLHYDDGTLVGDYVQMIECRVIVPGQSVLLITHFSPVSTYATEATQVSSILASLDLDPDE